MKKKVKIIIISLLCLFIVGTLVAQVIIYNSFNNCIPVLAYHVISDNPKSDMEVNTKDFEKQMKYLSENNYEVMNLDDIYNWKKSKSHKKGRKVAITFDDGDESYYTKALPILRKYHFKSTNFIITSRIGTDNYLKKDQIDNLNNDELVELEGHSRLLHSHDAAYSEDYDLYKSDMDSNRDFGFKYYAYPFGISNEIYEKALKDSDYKMAFKYSPSKWVNINSQNDYKLPRVPVYGSTSLFKFILKVLINK